MKSEKMKYPKGLVIVYTGNGKGKTSAAFGNVFRALGHGMRVLVVQFLKNSCSAPSGESLSSKHHPKLEVIGGGRGFCGIMGDQTSYSEHRKAARKTFNLAKKNILRGRYDLVVLDEINCAMSLRLVAEKDVVWLLKNKPAGTHVILTGRGIGKTITRFADLVTEMKEIKHPFRKGIVAQKGIDY